MNISLDKILKLEERINKILDMVNHIQEDKIKLTEEKDQ